MQVRYNKNVKTYSIKHIKQLISLMDKAECTGNCNGTPNCNLSTGGRFAAGSGLFAGGLFAGGLNAALDGVGVDMFLNVLVRT